MSKKYTFYSPEMHCSACELIVERTLLSEKPVRSVKANAVRSTVSVEGNFGESPDRIAALFSGLLAPKGYSIALQLTSEKPRPAARDLLLGAIFASLIIAGFVGLQKAGLVNLFSPDQMNLTASFLIGVIASLSSCMALVGGLLLSVAANSGKADQGSRVVGNVTFHASRLISFFFLGGLIGAIGHAFTLSLLVSVALKTAVALVMLVLGLNLLELFPSLKRVQLRIPSFLSLKLLKAEKVRSALTPALLGLITFFLPCGFTQSMQLVSLTSGSFVNGAMIMFVFAVGTFPVLAMISLASAKLSASRRSGIFFKTAGLVVIAFAFLNMLNSAAALGLMRPLVSV